MMTLRSLAILALSVTTVGACATGASSDTDSLPGQAGPLAIENVTVVPMDRERTVPQQTVLIREGRIVEIGGADTVEVPEEATRIDASGQYLMPGLAEMHAHLPVDDDPEGIRETVLFLFAANGVTFARGMQGAPDHPALRNAIAAGERFGPTLRVASPYLSGDVETADQARARVREYHAAGYDLLKVGEGLSPDVYSAVAEEARALDMPFAGHVADDVGLLRSLEAGQQTVDHLDNYLEALRTDAAPDDFPAIFGVPELLPHLDRSRLGELMAATEDAGTGVVPTMVVWHTFFDSVAVDRYRRERPEVRYLPPDMVSGWESGLANMRENGDTDAKQEVIALRQDVLQSLIEAEIPILLGSDAPQIFNVPGFSLHRELQYMQDVVGMASYDVLLSGTRAIAEFYGEADTFGTVREERRADLILVNGNPLEDVAHAADIAGVVVRGRWIGADEIQSRLDEIAEQYSGE